MVSLTIDGKNVQVEEGTTILDAAAKLGITIPTLCWLQKVSPTGACRVCAVEVEGVDRPMTACNTPAKDGLVVTTQSERLSAIRRKVVELLLVNHPLDCPVCDAGGECDLQNACFGLGASRQEYSALLERRPIRYDWPLIESDPNRCILCEKCVKVDHEVVGCDAIKTVNRGEATIIDTVDGKPLNCEFCGNCVGACPTGTLISKPFKFRGRPWSFTVTKSVCAFCSAGCQIEYHSRNNRVERVTSDDATYNSGNLCIHGRFGYSYLNTPDRLTAPLVNEGSGQAKADWNRAMTFAAKRLQEIVGASGADAVAGIGSPRVTNEESYLFQKLLRTAVGTNNIDSEARLGYATSQKILKERLGFTGASHTIDRIDTATAVLVLGCDLNAEATGVEYRVIRAATKNDAKLVLANTRDVKLKKFANTHLAYRPGAELPLVLGLMKAIVEEGAEAAEFISAATSGVEALKAELAACQLASLAEAAGVSEAFLREAARNLGGRQVALIFGNDVIRGREAGATIEAIANLALILGCPTAAAGGIFPIDQKGNTQGMLDMGVSPDLLCGYKEAPSVGRDLWQIVEGIEQGKVKALYLLGCNPLVTFPESDRVRKALGKLELLIVQEIAATELTAMAHVVFPGAAAAEKNGTFTTTDNRVQCLTRAVTPPGDAREDWDILAELLSRMTGAQHASKVSDITAELKDASGLYAGSCCVTDERCSGLQKLAAPSPATYAFSPLPTFAVPPAAADRPFSLVVGPMGFHNGTMSTLSENNLTVAPAGYVEIAAADAAQLGVTDGSQLKVTSDTGSITGPAKVSAKVPSGVVFAPFHFSSMAASALLAGNANVASVKVEKA
jgi:formate dehydrogenase alpha subunit